MANVTNLINLADLEAFYTATMNTGSTAPATTALWIDTNAGETVSAGSVTLTQADLTFLKNLKQLISLDMTNMAISVDGHTIRNAKFD